MRLRFSLFLVLFFQTVFSQEPVFKDEDYYKSEIKKNIFRRTITFQPMAEIFFLICYERELIKPFTLVVKAGPSIYTEKPDKVTEIEFTARASGELRYYFNLKRRIKHNKPTRNFSGAYLSLEPFVRSKALLLFNDPHHDERPAALGVYLNIGFQGQVKRDYVAVFAGFRFGAKDHPVAEVEDLVQAGFVIGRIF